MTAVTSTTTEAPAFSIKGRPRLNLSAVANGKTFVFKRFEQLEDPGTTDARLGRLVRLAIAGTTKLADLSDADIDNLWNEVVEQEKQTRQRNEVLAKRAELRKQLAETV